MKQAIVIIGGYNSGWVQYLGMARHLEDLSGLQAVGVPLMPWNWWAAGKQQEAGALLLKLEETVLWAQRKFGADRLILIGHSAGGVLARLFVQEQAVWGRVYGGHQRVAHVVTLGSPHCPDKGTTTNWYLTDAANAVAPGVPHADHVRYTTVVGRYILGNERGQRRERRAFRAYQFLCGKGNEWGDGIVPVSAASLDGAESLVLDGVAHSRKYGRNWYGGSKAVIRSWWQARRSDVH